MPIQRLLLTFTGEPVEVKRSLRFERVFVA